MSLNQEAVSLADQDFHQSHPEREGRPLEEGEENYHELSEEWMELYRFHLRNIRRRDGVGQDEHGDPVEGCPDCWIAFEVVEDASGEPVPGAVLYMRKADWPQNRLVELVTSSDGYCRRDGIEPGSYNIFSFAPELSIASFARLSRTVDFVRLQSGDGGSSESGGNDTSGEIESVDPPERTGEERESAGGTNSIPVYTDEEPVVPDETETDEQDDDATWSPQLTEEDELVLEQLGRGVRAEERRILIADIEEHRVEAGESLQNLAVASCMQQHDGQEPWQQLAMFNWGTSAEHGVLRYMRDGLGCSDGVGPEDPFRFDDDERRGSLFIPNTFSEDGLSTNETHVIRVQRLHRRVWISLQTVNEAGYSVGNVTLRLWSEAGRELCSITTDASGHWDGHVTAEGLIEVTLDDGNSSVEFFRGTASESEDGQEEVAVLDPMMARRASTSLLIRQADEDEELRLTLDEHRETIHTAGRRVYQLRGVEADRGEGVAGSFEEDGEVNLRRQGAPSSIAYCHRAYDIASDNLFIAGGWDNDEDRPNFVDFLSHLGTWTEDRYPEVAYNSDGYYVLVNYGSEIILYDREGPRWSQGQTYHLAENTEIRGRCGAYTQFEHAPPHTHSNETSARYPQGSGGPVRDSRCTSMIAFGDMHSRRSALEVFQNGEMVRPQAEDQWVVPLERHINERAAFRQAAAERWWKRTVFYRFPPNKNQWILAAFHGGTGIHEEYGGTPAQRRRIHLRNVAVTTWSANAFRGLIEQYVNNVEAAQDGDAIRALGPPPDPYIFPDPAGGTDIQKQRLFQISNGPSSLLAWQAINTRLSNFWGAVPEGDFFFRVQFELSQNIRTSPTSLERAVWQANFDIHPQQQDTIQISDQSTLRHQFQLGAAAAGLQARVGSEWEVDCETGATKTTVKGGLGPFEIEADSEGGRKVTFKVLGLVQAEATNNLYTGGMSLGSSMSLHDIIDSISPTAELSRDEQRRIAYWREHVPNVQLYTGIHFQGIQRDSLWAFFAGAPGFFQLRPLDELWRCAWASLFSRERGNLTTLGWDSGRWTRRRHDVSSYPECTSTTPLEAVRPYALLSAARSLGFTNENWGRFWSERRQAAEQRAQLTGSGGGSDADTEAEVPDET